MSDNIKIFAMVATLALLLVLLEKSPAPYLTLFTRIFYTRLLNTTIPPNEQEHYPERRKYRALVLVLASDQSEIYRMFKAVWESYMFTEQNIKVLFIYGNQKNTPNNPWDLVFPNASDGYPVHLDKVYEAFAYVDQHFEYDFLVRTNLSTFWILSRLLKHLDTLPTELCYEGDGPLKGSSRTVPHFSYVSGTDMIVNRYMVTSLVASKDILDFDIPEDAAMGHYFHAILGAPIRSSSMHFMEHLVLSDFDNLMKREILEANALDQSHFRIKTKSKANKIHQSRLNIDTLIAHHLLRYFYNKTAPSVVYHA